MPVSLPLALILLDFYPLKRLSKAKDFIRLLPEKLPFFLLAFLASLVALLSENTDATVGSTEALPVTFRLIVAIRAPIFYLQKMIAPVDLTPFYPMPAKIDLFTLAYGGSIIVFLLISIMALKTLRKRRSLSAFWFQYLLALMPVIGIVQVGEQAFADRYTYLPSLAPFILAGIGLFILIQKASKKAVPIILIAALIIFALFSVNTIRQIAVWKDSITLWSRAIELSTTPHPGPYSNRGLAYSEIGRDDRAIKDLNRAIEIDPEFARAYLNRGLVYRHRGNYTKAIEDYTRVIELSPKSAAAYNNRGVVYAMLEDYTNAIKDFKKVIEINPSREGSYKNLSRAQDLQAQKEQAGAK